ncbi:hypothetical protein ACXJJ3_03265 [Kribbella sp. WER1]
MKAPVLSGRESGSIEEAPSAWRRNLFGYDTANIGAVVNFLPWNLGSLALGYLVAGDWQRAHIRSVRYAPAPP